MTLIAVARRVTPTPAEVNEQMTTLNAYSEVSRTNRSLVDVYVAGYLTGLVKTLAIEHRTCRKAHCRLCRHLRYGLALVAAFDTITGGTP